MAVNPHTSFEAALPGIIAQRPKSIMRRRETRADSFGSLVAYTAGPFTVRIDQQAQNGIEVWDEKGQVARRLFTLLGYNIAPHLEEGGVVVPMFKPDDEITDQYGNKFVVVSPQYVEGKTLQLTLALRG